VISAIAVAALAGAAAAAALEGLGRQIVHEGRGADGAALSAHLGDPALPQSIALQGAATACVGCHAARNASREGNAKAPPLDALAFKGVTLAAFRAAINEGQGLDGRALDRAMPRYRLTTQELAQTLHYLQTPQREAAPAPTLATLFPLDPQLLAIERDALAGLRQCVERLDGAAERPVLRVERYGSREEAIGLWRSLIGDPQVAAILAPSLRGWSDAFAGTFEQAAVRPPVVVFPLADDPVELPPHAPVHWLFGGAAQRQAAIALARRRLDAAAGDGQDWRAAPARERQPAPGAGDAQTWGRMWADNTCAALTAALRAAPASAFVTPREDFARAWRSVDAVETSSGFRLRPSHRYSVNAWSVFQRVGGQPWRLIDPHAQADP
jgi:cytochrome c553